MEQYEIRLNPQQKIRFLDVAKKRMGEKEINIATLAKKAGYSKSSVYQFFNDPEIQNRFLAAKIAHILDIRREEWR